MLHIAAVDIDLEAHVVSRIQQPAYFQLLFFVCCYEIVYGLMGMYDSLWRYAEIVEFFRLCVASITAVVIFIAFTLVMFQERRVPISVYFLSAMFAPRSRCIRASPTACIATQSWRSARAQPPPHAGNRCGRCGASTLLHEVFKSNSRGHERGVLCGRRARKGGPPHHGRGDYGHHRGHPELVERCDIETILLAIPTLDEAGKRRILRICNKTKCNVRILPDIVQLIAGGKRPALPRARRARGGRV